MGVISSLLIHHSREIAVDFPQQALQLCILLGVLGPQQIGAGLQIIDPLPQQHLPALQISSQTHVALSQLLDSSVEVVALVVIVGGIGHDFPLGQVAGEHGRVLHSSGFLNGVAGEVDRLELVVPVGLFSLFAVKAGATVIHMYY